MGSKKFSVIFSYNDPQWAGGKRHTKKCIVHATDKKNAVDKIKNSVDYWGELIGVREIFDPYTNKN